MSFNDPRWSSLDLNMVENVLGTTPPQPRTIHVSEVTHSAPDPGGTGWTGDKMNWSPTKEVKRISPPETATKTFCGLDLTSLLSLIAILVILTIICCCFSMLPSNEQQIEPVRQAIGYEDMTKEQLQAELQEFKEENEEFRVEVARIERLATT